MRKRADDYPAARVALRSASADAFILIDSSSGEIIGTVEAARAYTTVHEGAIYLHMGRSYRVLELDLAGRRAMLEPFSGDYFTQTKRESMTYIERLLEQREVLGVRLFFGQVSYSETVIGYQRKGLQDHAVIDFQTLDLPTVEFPTRALWYELDDVVGGFPIDLLLGSLRARARPDRGAAADRDVRPLGHRRVVDERPSPDRGADDLHLRRPSRRRRDYAPRLRPVRAAGQRRPAADRRVPVHRRLPSCLQSPKCGNLNEPLSKRGALELLSRLT